MRVFEVITEHCKNNSKEIMKTVQYVTSEEDTLVSVVRHFTEHYEQDGLDLISFREVLIIAEHIKKKEYPLCEKPDNSWEGRPENIPEDILVKFNNLIKKKRKRDE